jgi:uncharacterized protein YkwD
VFARHHTSRFGIAGIVAIASVLAAVLMPAQPAIAVTSARSNTVPITAGNGYDWIDYYRGLAGLGAVSRNATIEAQEASHVRYLANRTLSCETNVHDELTSRVGACGANRAATAAGKVAANNSNVTRVSADVPDQTAVGNWFGAAFHALTLLDPRLASTGYAAYYTPDPQGAGPLAWKYTAAVDVYRGRTARYNGSSIAFPATNAVTPLLSYTVGSESPEPFRSTIASSPCHSWGNRSVVSSPIIVQWPLAARGAGATGSIVDLTAGRILSTCTLNANFYPAGSEAKQFLGGANGITRSAFYFTTAPFVVGHRYQLRIAGGVVTTFMAGNPPAAATVDAEAAPRAADLSWTAPSTPGTGTIARYVAAAYSGTACAGTAVSSVSTTARAATLGGLVSGRYYSVRVAVFNSVGASRWGNCVVVRPT